MLGFPCGSDGKECACNVGDLGWFLGSRRTPGKGMATQSSILAWKIQWTEEPGRLQFMGLQRVGDNWATNTEQQQICHNNISTHKNHFTPSYYQSVTNIYWHGRKSWDDKIIWTIVINFLIILKSDLFSNIHIRL